MAAPLGITNEFDTVIIGGGVVGCAVFRQLVLFGYKCALLEKNSDVLQGASKGNSGIACTGYDAPEGSIERKCIRRGMQLNPIVYSELGLPSNPVGSLVVAWTKKELELLPTIVKDNHSIGDTEVRQLSIQELYSLEPNLAPGAKGAVLIPGEVIVEPWLIPIALLHQGIQNGGHVFLNHEVVSGNLKSTAEEGHQLWELKCSNGTIIKGRSVINCAGNFGDIVERIHVSNPSFEIRPRKGQFLVFEQTPEESPIISHPIQPVSTEETKGVFLFRTLYGNILVGPTAEEQADRQIATNDKETLRKLKDFANGICPEVGNLKIVGSYAGLRPATQFRDYQISMDLDSAWITVGGIRSTGVTACLGIAEYVAGLQKEFNIRVDAEGATSTKSNNTSSVHRKMPTLPQLSKMFLDRGDGSVVINGIPHSVHHGITKFGCFSGI